jgi:hypothetical protein
MNRLGNAFDLMLAQIGQFERVTDQAASGRSDHDLIGRGTIGVNCRLFCISFARPSRRGDTI